ncbi:MAG: SPFH domain-containing protein, partial [Haloechinothrix sp.]
GQAKAIEKVFASIKSSKPTPEVLAYQYLQTLPQMAQGDANKVWMVPSDYGKALEGFARALGAPGEDGVFRYEPPKEDVERPVLDDDEVASWFDTSTDPKVAEAVREAEAVARKEVGGPLSGPASVPPVLSSLKGDPSALAKEEPEEPPAAKQPEQQAPPQQLPPSYGAQQPPSGPFPSQGPQSPYGPPPGYGQQPPGPGGPSGPPPQR